MSTARLFEKIRQKQSYLCIGLDSDADKIPSHLNNQEDPVFEFNKAIIDNTHDTCVSYKINTAFYETNGAKGWKTLEKTINYIKQNYPEIFVIADAKRGDIGNTARMYARTFFETLNCDAATVTPYMGKDSAEPFLEFKNKWTILLGLTSNEGAFDFQYFYSEKEKMRLFEKVISTASCWGNKNNTMFVFGATKVEELEKIRKIIPEHFLLVPGIGAQGGSLEQVSSKGMNKKCGLLINSSRSIIFSDSSHDFHKAAREKATALQQKMMKILKDKQLI
ncbi:MAG: orotidine-5'-phosphate decarboxylase [Bacteroidales bacterium]